VVVLNVVNISYVILVAVGGLLSCNLWYTWSCRVNWQNLL